MNIEKTDRNYQLIAGNPEQTEWVKEKVSIDPASIIGYVKMADSIGEEYRRKRCAIS